MTDRNERRPGSADKTVRDIRRATRRRFSAEEKIRIVLEGLRGEETIAELCRKDGIKSDPEFALAAIAASYPFKDEGDKKHFLDGLRKAGLS